MVRVETSPEDLAGMAAAQGILTARGGMTSHAAVVARGMGKCCVSGAGALKIDYASKTMEVDGLTLKEGDYISLNGSTGDIFLGQVGTSEAELDADFAELMTLSDKHTRMTVRTNADTPHDATIARKFGATGIGLCRTEHMFFEGEKIKAMREMILASDETGRRIALAKILPYQEKDFEGIFEAMDGCPVTVRLLDPPLHEFVPHDEKGQREMAEAMGVTLKVIKQRDVTGIASIRLIPFRAYKQPATDLQHSDIDSLLVRLRKSSNATIVDRNDSLFVTSPQFGHSR